MGVALDGWMDGCKVGGRYIPDLNERWCFVCVVLRAVMNGMKRKIVKVYQLNIAL